MLPEMLYCLRRLTFNRISPREREVLTVAYRATIDVGHFTVAAGKPPPFFSVVNWSFNRRAEATPRGRKVERKSDDITLSEAYDACRRSARYITPSSSAAARQRHNRRLLTIIINHALSRSDLHLVVFYFVTFRVLSIGFDYFRPLRGSDVCDISDDGMTLHFRCCARRERLRSAYHK